MRKKGFILLILSQFFLLLFANFNEIEDLMLKLQLLQGSDRIETLTILGEKISGINPDKGEEYINEAFEILKKDIQNKNKFDKDYFENLILIGKVYQGLHDYDKALETFYLIKMKSSESNFIETSGKAQLQISDIYHNIGEKNESINILKNILNDKSQYYNRNIIAETNYRLGTIYRENHQYQLAEKYLTDAFNYFKALDDELSIGNVYTQLGYIHTEKNEYDLALNYHQKALSSYKKIKNLYNIGWAYNNLGWTYYKMDDLPNAIKYNKLALEYRNKTNKIVSIASSKRNIGNMYFYAKDYRNALKYLMDCENDIKNFKAIYPRSLLLKCYYNLYETYSAMKRYKKANTYLLKYIELYKELHNNTINSRISDIKLKYELSESVKKSEVNSLIDKLNKRYIIFAISAVILFLFIIFFLSLKILKSKKNIKNLNTDIDKLNLKLLESIHFYKELKKYRDHLEDLIFEKTKEVSTEINNRKNAEKDIVKLNNELHILENSIEEKIKTSVSNLRGKDINVTVKFFNQIFYKTIETIFSHLYEIKSCIAVENEQYLLTKQQLNDIRANFNSCSKTISSLIWINNSADKPYYLKEFFSNICTILNSFLPNEIDYKITCDEKIKIDYDAKLFFFVLFNLLYEDLIKISKISEKNCEILVKKRNEDKLSLKHSIEINFIYGQNPPHKAILEKIDNFSYYDEINEDHESKYYLSKLIIEKIFLGQMDLFKFNKSYNWKIRLNILEEDE